MAPPYMTLKELDARYMNSMMDLARRLPPEVVYACGIIAFAHSTTGKHSATNSATISGVEVLKRYMEDKIAPYENLPKEGKDGFTNGAERKAERTTNFKQPNSSEDGEAKNPS